MPNGRRVGRLTVPATLVALALLCLLPVGAPLGRAAVPTVPLADDRYFVQQLTGAELTPGAGGPVTMTLGNPLPQAMIGVALTIGIYAFNGFPGNATGDVAVASAPVLSNQTGSGLEVNESYGSIATGAAVPLSVPVQTSTSTPSGTFAVRFALRFVENGTHYLLESRGWFTAAQWAAGTTGPNGTVAVNLTALGVSGLLPETSILVSSNGFAYVLWGVLGAGVVVVAVGAWLYFRRSNSSSGTRPPAGATQAPSALGRSRTNEGD